MSVPISRISAANGQCETIRSALWRRHKEWHPETIERLLQELERIERAVLGRNGKAKPLKPRKRKRRLSVK